MEEEILDILNLCLLNQMEEKIAESPAPERERDDYLTVLDWRRRNLMLKIMAKQQPASAEAMQRHIDRNTVDGEYVGWVITPILEKERE